MEIRRSTPWRGASYGPSQKTHAASERDRGSIQGVQAGPMPGVPRIHPEPVMPSGVIGLPWWVSMIASFGCVMFCGIQA